MYQNIDEFIGKTVRNIEVSNDSIRFEFTDNSVYMMAHNQDCCESVTIEDINGDPQNFMGQVILEASESSSIESESESNNWDGGTWTFYRIACNRDFMVIRWFGTSNGYYSESVDIMRIK